MRDAGNIREVEALLPPPSTLNSQLSALNPPPLMGFIFWPKSSRFVSERPAYLPVRCKRVGVFVDEEVENVCRIADDYALDFIQLHGKESPAYLSLLRDQLEDGKALIKAFNIATPADLSLTADYEGIADYFLFDTKGKSVGGNGEKFDWSVLSAYQGSTPFLLSGGIGPDDAERVNAFRHPRCIGIDLNSRFEVKPGVKDVTALARFLIELSNLSPLTTKMENVKHTKYRTNNDE